MNPIGTWEGPISLQNGYRFTRPPKKTDRIYRLIQYVKTSFMAGTFATRRGFMEIEGVKYKSGHMSSIFTAAVQSEILTRKRSGRTIHYMMDRNCEPFLKNGLTLIGRGSNFNITGTRRYRIPIGTTMILYREEAINLSTGKTLYEEVDRTTSTKEVVYTDDDKVVMDLGLSEEWILFDLPSNDRDIAVIAVKFYLVEG